MNMTTDNYAHRLSEAISWLRFPLIVFIICLHSMTTVVMPGEYALYFRALYPVSQWLGESAVPAFFFISGYLFFISKKNYLQKLNTRVHTLLIPYLLWNLIMLALYVLAYLSGHPQEIYDRSIADYSIADYLRLFWDRGHFDMGNFMPVLCPLWYIRNLLIMSVLSPLLYLMIKKAGIPFLLLALCWWLQTHHNAFIQLTVMFFSLGAYFSIHQKNPLQTIISHKRIVLTLWAVFSLSDIACHIFIPLPINLQIHRLALLMNIPALLLLADACCRRGMTNQTLPNTTFIIFCVHYPLTVFLRKMVVSHFASASDAVHIMLYFACVVVVTLLSLAFCLLLDKFFPSAKKLLAGNR